MNINTFPLIVALAGQALIVSIFFYFIPESVSGMDVRVLDCVAVSVVFWLWAAPMCALSEGGKGEPDRQIGSIGVRLLAGVCYSLPVLLLVTYGVAAPLLGLPVISFKLQLLAQCLLLFALLVVMVYTGQIRRQVRRVRDTEAALTQGKTDVASAISHAVLVAVSTPGVPDDIRQQIRQFAEQCRYFTPSASAEAAAADNKIIADCETLGTELTDYAMNKERIDTLLERLRCDLEARRAAR